MSDAETNLKREVALETAIDDLDIENTMLASAIDQLEGGLDRDQPATTSGAITTFAAGLAAVLEREAERLKDASTEDSRIQGAFEGLTLLAGLVDKAHDRAIESRAGLPVSPEPLDALIDAVKTLITLQGGERMSGHIGSGSDRRDRATGAGSSPDGADRSRTMWKRHDSRGLPCRLKCRDRTSLSRARRRPNHDDQPRDGSVADPGREWRHGRGRGSGSALLRVLIPTAEESHE